MRKEKENNIIEIKEEVQIGNIILEKGDKIEVMKENLKEVNGWEIQRGKEWDAYEDALGVYGAEEMADSLARAMGTDELGSTLAIIFRSFNYQSPFLRSY